MTQPSLERIVSDLEPELVSFLQEMVRIPSENPPGRYREIAEYVAAKAAAWGLETEIVAVPADLVAANGLEGERLNVIARLRGEAPGATLIYNGHLDTVPAGDAAAWSHGPFSGDVEDGRIWGRGAVDSKGRLASYIVAAVALKRAGTPLRGDLVVAATCDEETGGELGAGYVVKNGHVRGDMAVVEGYSDQIIRAMAGCFNMEIITRGRSAHAGWKWKGLNAIVKMARVIDALEELGKELEAERSSVPGIRYTTMNIGTISGGTKVNVVPDYCRITVDFRVMPEHGLDEIKERVERRLRALAETDPELVYEIRDFPGIRTEPTITRPDAAIVQALAAAVRRVRGVDLPVVGVSGQSDARWFMAAGIEAVNYGPGTADNRVHAIDEFIDIDDLRVTTVILAELAREILAR